MRRLFLWRNLHLIRLLAHVEPVGSALLCDVGPISKCLRKATDTLGMDPSVPLAEFLAALSLLGQFF